jgi:type IV pilus assembly protein PilW
VVELMVALAVAAFFIMATMTLAGSFIQVYRAQERVSEAQQGIRAAMDLMVRDIRMAGYDPMALSKGRTAGAGIIFADKHRIRFAADLDGDGAVNGSREDMTYFYEAGTKRLRQRERGDKDSNQTLMEDVSAFQFIYLDADGVPAAATDAIVSVVVSMTVEDRDHKGGTFKRTLTTRVNCRNLRN